MILTEKLSVFDDGENGHVVRHVYIGDDDRRRTDFYICGSREAAVTLIRSIRKPDEIGARYE